MNYKTDLLVGLLGFLFAMFIFWYGGVDFNERGRLQAFALFISSGVAYCFYCFSYDGDL